MPSYSGCAVKEAIRRVSVCLSLKFDRKFGLCVICVCLCCSLHNIGLIVEIKTDNVNRSENS